MLVAVYSIILKPLLLISGGNISCSKLNIKFIMMFITAGMFLCRSVQAVHNSLHLVVLQRQRVALLLRDGMTL
jgi:hypothetical protein